MEHKKILIVDDAKSIRDYLKEILKSLNTSILEADNGDDAYALIQKNEFDMILMDIAMPGLSGIEVTHLVRNDLKYEHTPIILITGLQNPDLIKSGFENGATDYISKPLNEVEVISRINHLIENRRLSLELVAAKEAAEQANQYKSDFVSRLAHELKTPLNGIMGLTNIIKMEYENNDIQENCRLILEAADHQLELINEVTSLAKIEAGIIDLEITSVELPTIIKKTFSLIKPVADKHRVTINLPHLSDVKYLLLADSMRLKQVFLNLLSNAVKYNRPNGEVNFLVVIENNQLKIGVSDTGHGIKAEDIPKLFEVFNRLGAENTDIEGSGIGLAISRKIIEMMDGKLEVESELGKGSTFWIVLNHFETMSS